MYSRVLVPQWPELVVKQVPVLGFEPVTFESAVESVSVWATKALVPTVENRILDSDFSPSTA